MLLFDRLKVRFKLVLLAGVPVLGTLLLSALVVRDVQERAEAAAGLGSIENLAQLTEQMLQVLEELQWERAETTFIAGSGSTASAEVETRQKRTDAALTALSSFLKARDENKLPPKLRQDLKAMREQLVTLPAVRMQAQSGQLDILAYLAFYAKANESLISATAALTQLSTDKELLLSIGGLVSAMQVIERDAREHALLNYVIGKQEFPAGTFRYWVTLLTEQEVYTDSLRTWASEEEFAHLKAALKGPQAEAIAKMRAVALETTEGSLPIEAQQWATAQNANQQFLVRMEHDMAGAVRAVAAHKVTATHYAVRLAIGLVAGVVGMSLLIGWAIARSLTRSVRVLSAAATAVHENDDFTIRAEKTSSDELGLLTDAFNGMLAGIQDRDRELDTHRRGLEALVEARTRQLSERNEEMQLVLDNIDQGLAMIDQEGKFLGESSRTFREAFGKPEPGMPFHTALVEGDEDKSALLGLGYEQLMADVMPIELALDQMPRSIVRGERNYSLSFTCVMHDARPTGALLVTRDVTEELRAHQAGAQQRERVLIIERIMRDRVGFQEFLDEANRLVTALRAGKFGAHVERMRALHTLKGLAAVFDVVSVAEAAHGLEQAILEEGGELARVAEAHLLVVWDNVLGLVMPLVGEQSAERVEITVPELERLIERVRAQTPHAQLLRSLQPFAHEPVALRFQRLRDQLERVARRLGKPDPLVHIQADDVRLPAAEFREFWSSLAHVVRNVVDHGLEPEAARVARGKPKGNTIRLTASRRPSGVSIQVSDDGQGIDWERLADRARANGLPADTRAELTLALFADGVSTAQQVSQTSGRGVGMSAVREACLALGGSITVESERGQGTSFSFMFPRADESVWEATPESEVTTVAAR